MAGAPASPETVREMVDLGCNFLSVGADVVGLAQYVDRLIAEVSAALDKGP